jgi:stress-induced morphogen
MTPEQLKTRLESAFPGDNIEVIDLTGTHDHYEVHVESEKFKGLLRIQQHQKVMGAVSPELQTGELHALSIKTKIKLT